MNKQLLDPIGTMCKLVGLIFSKLNTKIKISKHILMLDKPNQMQFFFRWLDHADKENISELYYVVVRIIIWYLVPQDEIKESNNINLANSFEFRKMVNYLCDSFKKLQDTYLEGNVVLALQFYINILQDALAGKFNVNKLPKCVIKKDQDTTTLLDYNKIKNLWDSSRIKRVCDLYDSCFVVNEDSLPDITKEALIDGYLKSIGAILDITDAEFQDLISNSTKG